MIIFTTLMVFGIIGFMIPKKYLWRYMLFSAICIPSLYFFYTPFSSWDLARHYRVLRALRLLDFRSVVFGTVDTANTLVETYVEGSRLYLIYAYLISLCNVDGLLPALTGMIIYTVIFKIIIMSAEDVGGDIEDWKISFCYFFILAALDFRTISGIRNMLAYALFAYVVYIDLVRNGNKIVCFFLYFLFANIHSSIYILILLRLIMMFKKMTPKLVILALVFLIYSFLDVAQNFLARYSNFPLVMSIIDRIKTYSDGGGTQLTSTFLIIRTVHLVQTIIYLLLYLYVKNNIPQSERFKDYGFFYLMIIVFALGAFRQYDIFVRSNMLMYFLVFPFMLYFFKYVVCETPFELNLLGNSITGIKEIGVYAMIYVVIIFSLIIYMAGYYPPMDVGFVGFRLISL